MYGLSDPSYRAICSESTDAQIRGAGQRRVRGHTCLVAEMPLLGAALLDQVVGRWKLIRKVLTQTEIQPPADFHAVFPHTASTSVINTPILYSTRSSPLPLPSLHCLAHFPPPPPEMQYQHLTALLTESMIRGLLERQAYKTHNTALCVLAAKHPHKTERGF